MIEATVVSEDDVAQATRDADRVRHWLTQNDQDFVVRVHAAVVGAERADVERPRAARSSRSRSSRPGSNRCPGSAA